MQTIHDLDLGEEIHNIQSRSPEAMYQIIKQAIANYFGSLVKFGAKSSVSKDNLSVISEYRRILKKEKALFGFILENRNRINKEAALELVYDLDHLNDMTLKYYYEVLGEIEDANEMAQESRGVRPKKNFSTLIESDEYDIKAIALLENLDSVKKYLNFPDDFWSFISNSYNLRIIDVSNPEGVEAMSFVTPIYNQDGTVHTVIAQIPKVVNLFTAKKAIEILTRAFTYYRSIGKEMDGIVPFPGEDQGYERQYLAQKKRTF